MGRVTLLRAAACLAAGFLAAAAPSARAAPQQREEEDDFLNTSFVGDEAEAARLAFYKAEELLGGKQPKEAGREILKLLRGETRGIVRVGERLIVPVETAALLFLLRLPDAVRAELAAELAREEANGVVASAPADPESAASLRDFAARHPLTASGESAQFAAGVRELLAGEAGAAAADLERLVHWPSAWPGATRVVAAARLLEAQARTGGFVDGPLSHWPKGVGLTLVRGGAEAPFDALLAAMPPAAAGADPGPAPRLEALWPEPPAGIGFEASAAPHRWRYCRIDEMRDGALGDVLRDLPTRAPLLLDDGKVAVVDADGLHVRRLADGAECFPPLRFDFDLHVDPKVYLPRLDRVALARAGRRLYLTVELASQAPREDPSEPDVAGTALFALDLERECYVDFAVTTADLAAVPELAGHVFSGAAFETGGRVLVAASRLVGKESEVALLAFDAASGAPAGQRLLARAGNVPRYGQRLMNEDVWRVAPAPLVVRDGVAYVCTNVGLIAAVRAADLELAWGFRYHRRDPPNSEQYAAKALYSSGGPWVGAAPVALADRVVACPTDSDFAYSLARWPGPHGELKLNRPIAKEHRVALIGATDDTLFFVKREGDSGAGSWSIEATDHDGVERWSSVPLPFHERIVGTPVVTRRFLYVPTDRVIYPFALAREGFCDRPIALPERVGVPPPEFAGFGDLSASGTRLLSTSALYTIVLDSAKE